MFSDFVVHICPTLNTTTHTLYICYTYVIKSSAARFVPNFQDSLLISFPDCRLSIIHFNNNIGNIETVSIFNFDPPYHRTGNATSSHDLKIRVDPLSRCASLQTSKDTLFILPLYVDYLKQHNKQTQPKNFLSNTHHSHSHSQQNHSHSAGVISNTIIVPYQHNFNVPRQNYVDSHTTNATSNSIGGSSNINTRIGGGRGRSRGRGGRGGGGRSGMDAIGLLNRSRGSRIGAMSSLLNDDDNLSDTDQIIDDTALLGPKSSSYVQNLKTKDKEKASKNKKNNKNDIKNGKEESIDNEKNSSTENGNKIKNKKKKKKSKKKNKNKSLLMDADEDEDDDDPFTLRHIGDGLFFGDNEEDNDDESGDSDDSDNDSDDSKNDSSNEDDDIDIRTDHDRRGRNMGGGGSGGGGRNMGGKRGNKQDALRDKIYSMPSMSLTHKINEDMIMTNYLNITEIISL